MIFLLLCLILISMTILRSIHVVANGIKKIWYIYKMQYHSTISKNEIMPLMLFSSVMKLNKSPDAVFG